MFQAFIVLLITQHLAPGNSLDDRILGGEDVDIRDYPYQMSLQYYGEHLCGAAIISPKFVITAAHCTHSIPASGLSLVGGTTELDKVAKRYYIDTVREHPEFSPESIENDIAILRLQEDIAFDEHYAALTLPEAGYEPPDGASVTVSGWGVTEGGAPSNRLKAVTVRIKSRKACRHLYGEEAISDGMICAGSAEGGKDACQKDSGGPMVADGTLVGVVSWGHGCGLKEYPGVYTHVAVYRKFIDDIIDANN